VLLGIAGIAATVAILFWLLIPRRHGNAPLLPQAQSQGL
jgi:hypothetical protein